MIIVVSNFGNDTQLHIPYIPNLFYPPQPKLPPARSENFHICIFELRMAQKALPLVYFPLYYKKRPDIAVCRISGVLQLKGTGSRYLTVFMDVSRSG